MTTDSLMLNYKMEKRFLAVSETEEIDAFLTPWSIVHVASGGFARKLGINFWLWQVMHAGYEMKDFMITKHGGTGTQYNSFLNSVGDQISATLGWYLAKHGSITTWGAGLGFTFLTMVALGEQVG